MSIELDSPTMANDADPTLAADLAEGETQSIHAWSQADDGEAITTYIPRRSWKLPAAALALATASAIGAGVFLAFPQQSAGKPLVAPPAAAAPAKPTIQDSPPVRPQSADERFLALLPQRHVLVVSPPLQLKAGHEVCTRLAQGWTAPELAQGYADITPGADLKTEAIMVDTAIEVYCPGS